MSQRADTAMFNEGQLLTLAAQRDVETAAEHARGVIDGCFNALLRLEDSEDVTKFAFALADRIAGKIKAPTAWPLPQVVQVDIAPVAAPAPEPEPAPTKPEPQRFGFWTIFALGYGCAAIPAAIIIANIAVR